MGDNLRFVLLALWLFCNVAWGKAGNGAAPNGAAVTFIDNGKTYEAPFGTLCFLTFEDKAGAATFADVTGQCLATATGSPTKGAVPAALPSGAFPTGFCLGGVTAANYLNLAAAAKGGAPVPFPCQAQVDFDYYRTSNTATGGTANYFFSVNKTGVDNVPWGIKTVVAASANDGALSITVRAATANGTSSAPFLLLAGEWYHIVLISEGQSCSPTGNTHSATVYIYRYSTATWTKTGTNVSLSGYNAIVQFITMTVGVANVSGVMTPMIGGNITNFLVTAGTHEANTTPILPIFRRINYSFKAPELFLPPLMASR